VVSKSQRERQLARAKWERQQARRQQQSDRRRRRTRTILAAVLSLLVVAGVAGVAVWFTQGDDDLAGLEADPAATPSAVSCTYVDDDSGHAKDVGRPPATPLDPAAQSATLTLDGKDVEVVLEPTRAPCTVNSWQFLASKDFFADTPCHRLTTAETLRVLQCGSPDGSPDGGPGYRFAEENLDGATYPAGTVAMARTDEPATTGSQFFVVYADSQLPAEYTVVGRVVSGLGVVQAIAKRGLAEDGVAPAKPVTLDDLVVVTG
jgi:peptidyl-prolyl cis-trans isomerase B (cyclophilin B)